MTKYDELGKLLIDSEAKWKQYEEDAMDFARNFRQALIDYLEAPKENVRFVKFGDIDELENMVPEFYRYTISKLMWLGKDSFWRFQIFIEHGIHWVRLVPWVKPIGEKYIVHIHGDVNTIEVSKDELPMLVEMVMTIVETKTASKFDDFIEGKLFPDSSKSKGELGFPIRGIETSSG